MLIGTRIRRIARDFRIFIVLLSTLVTSDQSLLKVIEYAVLRVCSRQHKNSSGLKFGQSGWTKLQIVKRLKQRPLY
jgi:hypothetical protein